MLDIDHFKNYNDTLGHQAGDEVLRSLGRILKETVRENDIVARYGGEEFAVVLPNCDLNAAVKVLEAIGALPADQRPAMIQTLAGGDAQTAALLEQVNDV